MKLARVAVAVFSMALLVGVASAYAQAPCCGGGPGGWGAGPAGKGAAWKGFDLSADQQKQFKQLRLDFLKKTEPLRTELSKKRLEMMELNASDKYDDAAAQKTINEMRALRDKMRVERRAFKDKMRTILTPEQRQKMGGSFLGRGGCPGGGRGGCGFGPGCGGFGRGRGWWGESKTGPAGYRPGLSS